MNTQGRYQRLIGCILTFVLVLFATGCGGGDRSSNGNQPPNGTSASSILVYADAGDIVAVRVGQNATLDGSASSTISTDPLTFAWSFTSKPDASNAELQNATSVNPDFIADAVGTYMVQLVVSAGGISSRRAIASVEVTIDGNVTGKRVHTSYPSRCADCHDGRYAAGDGPIDPVLPKAGDHLATSNMCQACHTTFGFDLIRFADHIEVFGNCSACHNGVLAIGKSKFHVTTTAECDDCHNTISFLKLDATGNYDHTGISSGCVTCHNGKTAIGIKHITDTLAKSNNDCSFCHTTTSFKDAYPDHSNITADGTRCDSCHGVSAQGVKVGHPDMSVPNVDCGVCHSVKQFSLGGVYNHRAVLRCDVCHTNNNTINAVGTDSFPGHLDPAGSDCGVCHGVVGGTFKNAIIDHSLASVVAQRCDACHGPAGTASSKKSATHITTQITPTVVDCIACHTPGNFATGTFDHSVDNIGALACSDCHNDTNTAGKSVNHITTTAECDTCHATGTFKSAVFHANIAVTNNCASCHDGVKSSGKSINHMPTVRDTALNQDQDCSDCHAVKFDNFTGGVFDHQTGVNYNCASCHDGVIALDKKVNHIPSQTECSQCHADTTVPGGFATATPFVNVEHPGYSSGCEGCHASKFFPVPQTPTVIKQPGHLPTNQDCHSCHTTNKFTPQIFTHKNIFSNCASCHDGNYFTSANAMGKAQAPSPHPVTTADCGLCHGIGANFKDGIFDHTGIVDNCSSCHGDTAPAPPTGAVTRKSSMTNPAHVTTTQDCSICHIPGTFATAVFNHDQIVNNCGVSCHGGSTPTATIKPPVTLHVDTVEDCSVCHNTTAFAGAKYDHTGIVNNCASCHDGKIALGKHGTHVPTSDDCSVCHLTTGFIPGNFDHVGIVDNCQSCHDGALAQGKIDGHVLTNQDCGVCHTTRGFIPATFDHSTVSINTRCDSCHGVTATGMDAKTNPPHIPTSLDCRSCHTTATFVGGTWLHDNSAINNCDSCHSPTGGASDKPGGHFATDLQCDACHSTAGWAPTSFSHDPKGNYPGDHRRDPGCSGCHGNIVTTPFVYPSARYAPFCAACHEGDFKGEGDHIGGKSGTVEQNKDCSGGGRGCHKVTDSGF